MEVADILPAVIFAELVQMVKINMENSHIISSISFIPGFIKKNNTIYIFFFMKTTYSCHSSEEKAVWAESTYVKLGLV